MTFDVPTLTPIAAALAALWAARWFARRFYLSAQPDEWLLSVRDGRLVAAGVGVSLLRRPGDVVVRFSSTMQRVSFAVDAISLERVVVRVEGFIFWSVAAEGDAPFRAYSRLGIANLLRPPPGLKHPKHLLTSPQHKAFQQILTAVVQRHASALPLAALVGRQDALVAGLTERLRETTAEMGVSVDQVEILAARPADATVQAELSVSERTRLHEEAERVRREAEARIEAAAMERERANGLARAAAVHAVKTQEEELARARELAAEARALEVARARIAREKECLDAALAARRAEAEATRDAESARASVLEQMSPAVREHERQVLVAQKVAESLRITDARWVSVGAASPAASVGAMIAGVREVLGAAA
jgi:flotillin